MQHLINKQNLRSVLVLLSLTISSNARTETVTPVAALGTSEFGAVDVFGDGDLSNVFVANLINGHGLIDMEGTPDDVLDDYHDNDTSWTNGWHSGDMSAGLPGGLDDGDANDGDAFTPPPVATQMLEFDLGKRFSLESIFIWQQNQGGVFGPPLAPNRGVDQFEILVSPQAIGDAFDSIGKFTLGIEDGIDVVPAQVFKFDQAVLARRVRLDILSAHSGQDLEFVGLGEVRFVGESMDISGDFNGNGSLDAEDLDLLSCEIQENSQDASFDLNGDGMLNSLDREVWIVDLRRTYFGDSNLDGEFNSGDIVTVFTAGEFEDEIQGNSTWSSGDWDGNKDFDSSDLVIAFTEGGYDVGPRPDAALVPEPSALPHLLFVLLYFGATYHAPSTKHSSRPRCRIH